VTITTDLLLQLALSGLAVGSIYAFVAVGFVTIHAITGFVDFAQGELAMVAALVAASLVQARVPLPVAALAGVAMAVLASLLVERTSVAPVRSRGPLVVLVMTVAASGALRGLALLVFGTVPLGMPAFTAGPPLALGQAVVGRQELWILAFAAISMTLLYFFFGHTLAGTAMRAAAANPTSSRLVGIRPATLALDPQLLLLDEPLSGLGGAERDALLELLSRLRQRGLATLWIEHDVPAVMRLADRVVVLDQGRKIAEGQPVTVAADPAVVRAYLGAPVDVTAGDREPTPGEALLTVDHLQVWRGSTRALRDVSLQVNRGEIVAVVGPNGAGKSTILGTLAGLLTASGGRVELERAPVLGAPAEAMLQHGVALVPERRQIFEPLTVEENLVLGSYRLSGALNLGGPSHMVRERLGSVFDLFPALRERRRQIAGTLSGGEQQMLAIGRALMAEPRLLMLDEPSIGLAPRVAAEIMRVLVKLRDAGTTVLLVEQQAPAALSIADRAYLLDSGAVVLEGPAEAVAADWRVTTTYFGDFHGCSDAIPARRHS
jgi:branched-chain amino acid transport system ATP-binding protein